MAQLGYASCIPMSQTLHKGAAALAAALVSRGVKRVFTLSGNHVMPVFDAALGAGIELIHVRHEAAAVHMADAWARITGEVGVALVTGGPGHANALGALYTAAMAESPVLLLCEAFVTWGCPKRTPPAPYRHLNP